MTPDEAAHSTSSSYHFVHLAPEEIERLPPDELLQACLEHRNLLLAIMGVLYSSKKCGHPWTPHFLLDLSGYG